MVLSCNTCLLGSIAVAKESILQHCIASNDHANPQNRRLPKKSQGLSCSVLDLVVHDIG